MAPLGHRCGIFLPFFKQPVVFILTHMVQFVLAIVLILGKPVNLLPMPDTSASDA
jgi:hypothetical protein